MNPQIVIQDLGGVNNANPDQTNARLIRGASWKKQRIITIFPADVMIPAKSALSIWNLIYPPNNGSLRILAQGMEVGEAYSAAIQQILAHPELSQWEFILTIEHDNCPPPDGIIKILAQLEAHPEMDAIGGLYFTKGEGGVAQIWGDINDPVINFRPQVPRMPGDPLGPLKECYGTGMGFTMFRLAMFKDNRLRQPWFKTLASQEGIGTQDLYFWNDAWKYGHRCAIDCSVQVGHYDPTTDIVW